MANEMRDRLVELIKQADEKCDCTKYCESCVGFGKGRDCINYFIADHLIENGVVVPPCKVGDVFYGINETSCDAYCVYGFKWGKRRGEDENVLIVLTTYEMEFVWGEEAFLTKEQAEQKLKEMRGG